MVYSDHVGYMILFCSCRVFFFVASHYRFYSILVLYGVFTSSSGEGLLRFFLFSPRYHYEFSTLCLCYVAPSISCLFLC